MRVGLGTGSTAHWFIVAAGEAVRSGLRIQAVATSEASARLAGEFGIELVELDRRGLDLAVDGADLIDPESRLIKGGGGAHVRERLVAVAARRFVVVADPSKLVPQLRGPVPVEVLRFGSDATLAALEACGAPFSLRMDPEGRPRVSDSGNLLGDGHFDLISDPEGLARRLDAVPGLVGHGLFLGIADLVLVGDETGGVREVAAGRSQ
jgi:ribose 5-phosphate isomerase A